MADYIDAGKLNKAAQVLELRETAPGAWEWASVRRAWASITFQSKTNLFSKVGIGARDAAVIVRRQPLTLHHALRWGDTHLFLTSITPMGRNHLEVDAAVVEVARCQADMDEGGGIRFPGVLTEKYARFAQESPYAANTLTYVLVTPKPIRLQRGGVVAVNGTEYAVELAHELDAYKNEYEITRTEDL